MKEDFHSNGSETNDLGLFKDVSFTTIVVLDSYYLAYKPITLACMSFIFIEMIFIHYHVCVIFSIKSMKICND